MNVIDIHSHLADHYFDDDRDMVISRMRESGVGTITIGVDLLRSKAAVELAEAEEKVWACIGVHPEDGAAFDEQAFELLAQHKKVVAIGECGLDYFRTDDKAKTRSEQLPTFEAQIIFAVRHDKPLMLHVRPSRGTHDAYDDVLSILTMHNKTYGEKLRGNAHFFAGTEEQAKQFFDLGFTISFTGVITFASEYDEVVTMAPLDMLHAETDAPYVAPKPYRGKKCEPQYVTEVIKKIAGLKQFDESDVYEQLRSNATRVFGI